MSRALARERERWEKIARADPYYAVLAHRDFLGRGDAKVRRAFFDSGEAFVDALLSRIASAGGSEVRTVLELGCGPGRLACAFARRGFSVTAVDIAPSMLELARRNAEERNVAGIDFRPADDFFRDEQRYDLVNAALVLQQMEPALGRGVLGQLASHVAPGGLLHVQFPFRSHRRPLSRLALALRRRLPAVNALFNVLKGRPAGVAVLAPHVYSLDDVLPILRQEGLEVRTIELAKENELEVATIVARRGAPPIEEEPAVPSTEQPNLIDVRELIRSTPMEELNRRAEQYFADAASFEAQLAKPFSSPADAPAMLVNLGVLLRGTGLLPGQVVLDFGSGTGWLSRRLTEMGCRMILADVSQTALRIAREHFETLGLMDGPHPPRFLHYGGEALDLPAESVDRIICFDSFHHVPNPDAVLREFGRVLKPGGIAAFSEPGPNHSRSAQSQYEMRAFGVIENDVDIDAIWSGARTAGFADMQLAAYTADPLHLPPERFKEIFRGGEALLQSAHAMRRFLENATIFFLRKAGEEMVDSRNANALACEIQVEVTEAPRAGVPIPARATVVNRGKASWLPSPVTPGGVRLGCHLYSRARKELLQLGYHWQTLSTTQTIAPGESVAVAFTLPPLEAGEYVLELDCVANEVAWFAQSGSTPALVDISVAR